MIFVSGFAITKILFTKKNKKSRLPCDNLAHDLRTYEPFYVFEGAYDGLIQVFQA